MNCRRTSYQHSPIRRPSTFPIRIDLPPSLCHSDNSLLASHFAPRDSDTSTMESKIPDFLAEQQAQGSAETQPYFLTFEDYWERKLWHQLTDSLVEFFSLPESAPRRLDLFKKFVLSFADRINQLKFVSLGLMAATECGSWCSLMSPGSLKTIARFKTIHRRMLIFFLFR